ncbi:MAG TPA: acetylxylan esterase [Blastocatellia bacterium]|nr:acetylxylan esterase [Blastocatellia bacterium]
MKHRQQKNAFIGALTFLWLMALFAAALAQQPAQDPLLAWLDRIAQEQLQRREQAIAEIRTVADAEKRKQWARAKILELIGGLPDYDGPLNARVTGRINSDSIVIEKVIFESLPRLFITANLYRPDRPGRHPAVLFSLGHWDEGKVAAQLTAANLAAKGFVVLAFDPLGQGERQQAYDRRLGRSLAGGSVNQHFMNGATSLLIGQSYARYRIWDAKRALDYLLSRPEVDSERVGCTGCSGGGTVTTYISALDPRIKVAAPACYMNSFRVLFAGSVGDSEQSLPNFLSSGLDQTDFVELFAPKPWLIASTLEDFFRPEGARLVYEEARRWYRIYGAEEKIRWVLGPGPHGTPREVREAIYEWMIRWLNEGKGDWREQPVKLYPNHELQVTRSGQVADEPQSQDLYQYILEDYRNRKTRGSAQELMAEIRKLTSANESKPLAIKTRAESADELIITERVTIETEPGLEITGTFYIPRTPGRKGAVLLVGAGGTASLAMGFAKTGRIALDLRPRGPATSRDSQRPLIGEWITNTRSWLIGRNLPAMRAYDISRGVDALAARNDVDPSSIAAVAQGVSGVWLLMAAALDTRIGRVWLDRTPYSFGPAFENPIHANLHDAVVPGFALRWDIQDLAGLMGKRRIFWSDPTDWMGGVVSLGPKYRYRYFDEPDDSLIEESLR